MQTAETKVFVVREAEQALKHAHGWCTRTMAQWLSSKQRTPRRGYRHGGLLATIQTFHHHTGMGHSRDT